MSATTWAIAWMITITAVSMAMIVVSVKKEPTAVITPSTIRATCGKSPRGWSRPNARKNTPSPAAW